MYYEQRNLPNKALSLFFLATLLLLYSSCSRDTFELPAPEEFSKKNRETLGEILLENILSNNQFSILPNEPPYDTTVYWYLQTLYDQATFAKHLDHQSPSQDKWNQNRLWQVHIIQDDSFKAAFTLPGGDFFISSGFLKTLREDYELYYLLTFESIIMDERFLLTRLIEEYNSLTLVNILQGNASANQISIQIIAEELPYLDYDSELVQQIDSRTVHSICESSVFERTGITHLLNNYDETEIDWLLSRESYDGRVDAIPMFSIESGLNCGELKSTGKYEEYVLNFLP